jgi:hypothetical protein
MNSKEKVQAVLNHKDTEGIAIDFGATPVTGIHALAIENIRKHYGLKPKLVKIVEPYQMLGEVDEELMEIFGVDVVGLWPEKNMFGIVQDDYKEFKTHWGQVVLVPGNMNTTVDTDGAFLVYAEGDTSFPPSAKMPTKSYFFDAIIRQEKLVESDLKIEDNLEEFGHWTDHDIAYWKKQAESIQGTDKAVIANFGGTGLGDIALVPAMNLKHPKGIRDIVEWYISTAKRKDFVMEIFDAQTDIALSNLKKAFQIVGNTIDAVFLCGTDFGTQNSTFCSPITFQEVYKPFYRKINDWIHENTTWKTFKHSCGAVENFMQLFSDAGFDIINPVQINAKGMDPEILKERHGNRLTFWGGGADTQKILPFLPPKEVKEHVLKNCEIFSKSGGFVFNAVHNVQANVPIENIIAMIDGLNEFNGR